MSESPVFTASTTPDAPRSDRLDLLRDLAADFRAIGYTAEGVAALLGPAAFTALDRDQLIPALIATDAATDNPLATIVRLWLLAVPQSQDAVDAALPTAGSAGLLALGLVDIQPAGSTSNGTLLRARVDLRPYGWDANEDGSGGADLWVASDLAAHQQDGVLRHDHVLGIGQASTTLVQTTVRSHAARALDLGTGCGIQSFHLLHHAEHVTATDISVRALAFTRFNLILNADALGIDPENLEDRVSLRLGSLLEPVAGETFDLVVSNPPFVITPRSAGEEAAGQFTYRDGGLPGDEIVSLLVAGLPAVLAPGGIAQLLGNWEVSADDEWSARPQEWIAKGTDAWFIQRELVSPEIYAETWLQDASQGRERAKYREAYAAYLADFASRQVTGIGFGMVFLRRPATDAPDLRLGRWEEITYPIEQPVGEHLGAAVDRFDWVARSHLGTTHLVVADDVTEERHQRPGAEHPGVILLRQGAGLRRTNLLSTELAGFISACDGDLSVDQIMGALVALLGGGDDFVEQQFRTQLLSDVRNLVLDGFLLPDS